MHQCRHFRECNTIRGQARFDSGYVPCCAYVAIGYNPHRLRSRPTNQTCGLLPTVQSGGVKKVRKAKSMPELHLRLVSFFFLLSSLLDQSIDVFETRSGISLVGGVVSD